MDSPNLALKYLTLCHKLFNMTIAPCNQSLNRLNDIASLQRKISWTLDLDSIDDQDLTIQ